MRINQAEDRIESKTNPRAENHNNHHDQINHHKPQTAPAIITYQAIMNKRDE